MAHYAGYANQKLLNLMTPDGTVPDSVKRDPLTGEYYCKGTSDVWDLAAMCYSGKFIPPQV